MEFFATDESTVTEAEAGLKTRLPEKAALFRAARLLETSMRKLFSVLAIAITAVRWFVVLSQRKEAVACFAWRWIRLWRKVTKQLLPVVHNAVRVLVQCQPRIVGTGSSPRQPFRTSVGIQVKERS